MKKLLDRNCKRGCIKEGEVHEFPGHVRVVLVEGPQDEEKWRRLGAAFVGMASIMIGANIAIIILYSMSFRENLEYSAHCLSCTVGVQFCIPLSILVLHSLHGPAAPMQRSQRTTEHILLSLVGIALAVPGSLIPFLYPRECTPEIHVYGAYATGGALGLSVLSGFVVYVKKSEVQRPTCVAYIHRFFGMISLLGSTFTYLVSIGRCRATMQLWLYTIGREAPLYMIYYIVIFYTLIVLFIPGSKFIYRTKYNDEKYFNFYFRV